MTYTQQQREFVLEQHEIYGALAAHIREIAAALDGGADVVDVLVKQTRLALATAMTREQLASGLVSLMVRVAGREDLLAPGAGTMGLYLSGALPVQVVRGGIRFPAPPEQTDTP